jgi:hypothetical protein
MLKWLIRSRLSAFERKFGYDTSYAREILDADTSAFFAFAKVQGMSSWRRDVPLDAYYAAKIVGTIAEDCGPCTQLMVTMALGDGVAPRTIAQILQSDDLTMNEETRLGARFARAVMQHDASADALREEILRRWGPRALVSLGFAIASSRIFPTLKYALGHGKTCERVFVAGKRITPQLATGAA